MLQEKLGERIRNLRQEKAGLSQEKFANKIEMDRTYYSAIERGQHSASITTLARIADGLDVTLEEMFEGLS